MQGDAKHPKAPLGNNFRPPQPLHHRPVRTNIDFNVKQRADVSISSLSVLFGCLSAELGLNFRVEMSKPIVLIAF